MTALHTERSKNESIVCKKIMEINNEFALREVQLVKDVVNKVYIYRDGFNAAIAIQETLLVTESKALEYEKLYTTNRRPEDLSNQRLLESEANDSQNKLNLLLKRVEIVDSELRETVKSINISNETYSQEINALYTVMEQQKLILENLVLSPIERLIIDSPVSFKSNQLSKANLANETIDTWANVRTTSHRSMNSTESSHNSSPSSSPRGERIR